jgi:hypothetical protein
LMRSRADSRHTRAAPWRPYRWCRCVVATHP